MTGDNDYLKLLAKIFIGAGISYAVMVILLIVLL